MLAGNQKGRRNETMKRGQGRIRTTHTGSLPRPPEIFAVMQAIAAGKPIDRAAYEASLTRHVADIVKKQVDSGIDVVNDGEVSKISFQHYLTERLDGFEARMPPGGLGPPTGPIGLDGKDATMFPDFYAGVLKHNPFADVIPSRRAFASARSAISATTRSNAT